LSRQSIHNAKYRGNLSPAIAGALAEKLGLPVDQWIVIAALESEKDSACKEMMLKRLKRKGPHGAGSRVLERAMGIEPTSSVWFGVKGSGAVQACVPDYRPRLRAGLWCETQRNGRLWRTT